MKVDDNLLDLVLELSVLLGFLILPMAWIIIQL